MNIHEYQAKDLLKELELKLTSEKDIMNLRN
jgi:succinyl-CoA synthetase beta subunit